MKANRAALRLIWNEISSRVFEEPQHGINVAWMKARRGNGDSDALYTDTTTWHNAAHRVLAHGNKHAHVLLIQLWGYK